MVLHKNIRIGLVQSQILDLAETFQVPFTALAIFSFDLVKMHAFLAKAKRYPLLIMTFYFWVCSSASSRYMVADKIVAEHEILHLLIIRRARDSFSDIGMGCLGSCRLTPYLLCHKTSGGLLRPHSYILLTLLS